MENANANGIPGTQIKKMASGFDVPWAIEPIDKRNLLVSERGGELYLVNRLKRTKRKINGLPSIFTGGQGGLLDVRTSLNFNKSKNIYFTYSKKTVSGSTTALAIAKLDIKASKLTEVSEIFEAKTDSDKKVHYGSRIAVTSKHIFITVGDRGLRFLAQDLGFHNGKVIRLNLDGTVPKDNPFISKKGALKEIYSFGHRNPQGITYIRKTGELFVSEHGPRGGDEINQIIPGANYGWPVVTYGKEYWGPSIGEGTKKKGVEEPLKYYVPSIAPSSLEFYPHDKIPFLKDKFLLGALVLRHLNVVSKDGVKEDRFYYSLDSRFRAVKVLRDGNLMFATDAGDIYLVSPQNDSSKKGEGIKKQISNPPKG